jgi:hypothetical protein
LAARALVFAGAVGFLLVILTGWLVVSFMLLLAALFIPVAYSLVYCRRLQRPAPPENRASTAALR